MQLLFVASFESVNPSHRDTRLAEELEQLLLSLLVRASEIEFEPVCACQFGPALQNGFLNLIFVAHAEPGDFRWAGRCDHAS